MINIAVILPSRGLVFSKTVEELLKELQPYKHEIYWSHGRPIPDCFEIPTNQILKKGGFSHILIIEEDMIVLPGTLKKMLDMNVHAVACDYPVTGHPSGTVLYDTENTAFFTGCGFLLCKFDLIKAMKKPIWRVDLEWNMEYKQNFIEFNIEVVSDKKNYGQQDIAFGLRLYANNMPIYVLEDTLGQRKLIRKGKGYTNRGMHAIKENLEVKKHDLMPKHYGLQEPEAMVEIELEDGTEIVATHEQAARYIAEGKAVPLKIGHAIFRNTKQIADWLWL